MGDVNGLGRPAILDLVQNLKGQKISNEQITELVNNLTEVAEDKTNAMGYGFYPDGRIIYVHSKDGLTLKIEDIINKTWNNAPAIGYWRMERNKIKTEYFSCSNSGNYIRKQGYIKGDTIFFERDCRTRPFKQKICYDKYILSNMNFGNVPDVLF